MGEDIRSTFGFFPIPDAPELAPGTRAFAAWEWARPLQAILKFGGWTIDDVVGDPRTAASVRQLWCVWNLVQRDSAERKARHRHAGYRSRAAEEFRAEAQRPQRQRRAFCLSVEDSVDVGHEGPLS